MTMRTVLCGFALLVGASAASAGLASESVVRNTTASALAASDRSNVASSDLSFILDDGTLTGTVGLNTNGQQEFASIYLNRFPVTQPLVINSISILWPSDSRMLGLRFRLVAYYDPNGSGNPSNAVRLGSDVFETITTLNAFVSYTVNFSVPGAGDIYFGFVDDWALHGYSPVLFPAAIDGTNSQGDSYVAYNINPTVTDIATLGDNSHLGTIATVSNGLFDGNWMIRGTGRAQPDCIFADGFETPSLGCST